MDRTNNNNKPLFLFLLCHQSLFPSTHSRFLHFPPSDTDHGLFIDWLLLPVCGTKRLKLDLQRGGFEINWAADRS